ncbi:MAG: ATP phosphoribosyltransferase regulatory subunit [Lachnospiraceae bacterium]|nr:ATP phosphoribosyltransferase regulatory subunit [Lachnospiraceae bacterium]
MSKELLHTTEGVRDFYGAEFASRQVIEDRIITQMQRFGYEGVDTPTFEYFDLFAGELSQASSKDLYKFFDKEGETLVLRPDLTPSMARCVSKYFLKPGIPVRVRYSGKTFMNTSSLQGKLNEYTQTGAELYNDGSVYADAEMIALMTECIRACGLTEFQISIGNAGYFKGLCAEAGLDETTETELKEQIAAKNYFAAEECLSKSTVSAEHKALLLKVSTFLKSEEDLVGAQNAVSNAESKEALKRLIALNRVLKMYEVDQYVSFDLGMLNRYNYYTGVIFKAYTYGVGDAIASGGRYDALLEKFGKEAPAIGFVILLDDLMNALYRQKISVEIPKGAAVISEDASSADAAIKETMRKRRAGEAIALQIKA